MRSNRDGFTLIELMIVVTILGILASIALPKFTQIKQRAYVTAMKSDLRNLVTSAEGFSASNDGDYPGGVTDGAEVPGVGGAGLMSFSFSDGVVLQKFNYKSNKKRGIGWNATLRHLKVKDKTTDRCGIFMGDDKYSPNKAVLSQGVAACW